MSLKIVTFANSADPDETPCYEAFHFGNTVLPRSNVYICLFVNIEVKTLGWHIQQPGVVLKTICFQLV